MIARIKTKNGFYDSMVFAIFKKGWNSAVVVFDEKGDALKLVKMWKPKRNVYIYNDEKGENWIVDEKVEGYKWILDNISKKLVRTVIDKNILPKCRELQNTVKQSEWLEINNDVDISGLMECTMRFHDAYVKDMYVEDGKQYILFDTTWGHDVLFELDGNVQTNLFELEDMEIGHSDEGAFFLDSAMYFENGLICWKSDEFESWGPDYLNDIEYYYFYANVVRWKLIIH